MDIANQTNEDFDRALRPSTFADFLGQDEVKSNLEVFVFGASQRGEALDHVLLSGPPGLGKTTLANILAAEMGSKLIVVNAPSIKTKGELASVLTGLNRGDVLFLDEIHGLSNKIEEVLYPAMEDYRLELVAGGRALQIDLEPFTLLGATTRPGMIQRPMRDRFGYIASMRLYSLDEMAVIIRQSMRKLGVILDDTGVSEMARRSRGTPRIANRLLRRVRDFMQFRSLSIASSQDIAKFCNQLGVDSLGLDRTMQKYLSILSDKNKPVALSTMVALVGESKDTVEEVIEPFLLQLGLIERTPRGRAITADGNAHLHGIQ